MTPHLIRGRHYGTGEPVEVACEDGVIVSVTKEPAGPARACESLAGPAGSWVMPAFFDLQINGCDGISFNSRDLTADQIRHVVRKCRAHGIGGLLPTLVTNDHDSLAHGFRTLSRARREDPEIGRAVSGFHLEGPYISPDDGPRGAHPRQHVRPPDWDEFRRLQDAAEGGIRLVTLAPEHEGSLEFIERLATSGVVVALGHTAASGQRIRDAASAGARLSTHLGNGCSALLHRHDNPIWEQLADDRLWVSVIADGHHLPPAILRCVLRVKTPARTILTCDASSLAGLPPGRYSQWEQEFEIQPGGKVVVAGTEYLAGSGAFTDECVRHIMAVAGVSLAEAADMAGARPRELLDLPPLRLEPGFPADVVRLEV